MQIPVTTTFTIEGYKIVAYKGVVRGIVVRSPTIAQGIIGGLKNIVGGRIGAYTQMCEQTRQHAYDLMIEHALQLGPTPSWAFATTPPMSQPAPPKSSATARPSCSSYPPERLS
jgi:hypothetical protein